MTAEKWAEMCAIMCTAIKQISNIYEATEEELRNSIKCISEDSMIELTVKIEKSKISMDQFRIQNIGF